MDKRLLTVVLAAILVALVITAIFYQITVGRKPAQASVDNKTLVVAKNDLALGSVITADDVRLVEYPSTAFPQGGLENIEDVVDRSVTGQILANEPVTMGRVTEKGAGFGLAPLIPDGYRAIAVAVNQVSGVSGFILPGSKVDVLLTAAPQGEDEQLTTTVLENVTVLSTGHRQEPDANGQPQNVPVVNMLLKPEDAQLLTLATQAGRIQLVLRNPKDEEEVAEAKEVRRASDLFAGIRPRQQQRPVAPRPARPAPAPVVEAPPPPIFEVEMIRGAKRSVEQIDRTEN